MDSDSYQHMRTVVAAPRLARALAIGSRFCARAAGMLERLGLAGVTPSAAVDRQLLEACAGFQLEGFRVQLVCAPFWSEELAVPPQPWRLGARSPHLLLGAWVDEEAGVVRLPGVLTAAELRQRCSALAYAEAPCPSPPSWAGWIASGCWGAC
jgi:hypothetical protein